jgi:hypothetical protein
MPLAKSQIRVVQVWQVRENPVYQRAGLGENDFAISIIFSEMGQ